MRGALAPNKTQMSFVTVIVRPLYLLAGKLVSGWGRPTIQPESPAELITDGDAVRHLERALELEPAMDAARQNLATARRLQAERG